MKKIKRKIKVPSIQKLASEVAKREGGKSNVKIGDVREILRILCEMECECQINDTLTGIWNHSPTDIICEAASKKKKDILKEALKKVKKQ
jgi:hypothetical protein